MKMSLVLAVGVTEPSVTMEKGAVAHGENLECSLRFGAVVSQQDLVTVWFGFGDVDLIFFSIKKNENYSSNFIIFFHVALKFCCPWESTGIKTLAFVLMEIILLKGNLLEI